jgi:hypothetical protein
MNTNQDILELLKQAQATPDLDLLKAFTQGTNPTSGLTFYDLEPGANKLFPVLAPFRNSIPRRGKGTPGIQANWRAITGINITGVNPAISQGNRGAIISTSTADYSAAYKGLGLEDSVTFEADYASRGFDDVRAIATQGLLESLMIAEEMMILGGNNSLALGTTPTPSLTGSASGGTLAAQTWSVICVALGFDAYWALVGYNNGATNQALDLATAAVPAQISRTNADGSTDSFGGGSAQKSTAATVVTTGATSSIVASVSPVRGAFGYAWFWGVAGSETLGAVTTLSTVTITAAATGTQLASALPAADHSTNSLAYDGLLAIALKSGSNAYYKALPVTAGVGSKLTSDGAGGVAEINTAFQSYWSLYRLSPDEIHVSSQELVDINAIVIANGGAPLIRFNMDATNPGVVDAGVVVGTLLNKIVNRRVKVIVHPNMPSGTLFFYTKQLPYKLSNVTDVCRIVTRQEYYQMEWPLRSRKYEYGVYCDEVLQHYFPPALGIITNIAPGS